MTQHAPTWGHPARRLLIVTNLLWLLVVVGVINLHQGPEQTTTASAAPPRDACRCGASDRKGETALAPQLSAPPAPHASQARHVSQAPSLPDDANNNMDDSSAAPRQRQGPLPAECPGAAAALWLPLWVATLPLLLQHQPQRALLLVDVGANRGIALSHWLHALHGPRGATLAVDAVKYAVLNGISGFCGACCECGPLAGVVGSNSSHSSSNSSVLAELMGSARASGVHAVAFEPLRPSFLALGDFFHRPRNLPPFTHVDVVHRAISDSIGTATTSAGRAGAEDVTIRRQVEAQAPGATEGRQRTRVYTTTLDHFFGKDFRPRLRPQGKDRHDSQQQEQQQQQQLLHSEVLPAQLVYGARGGAGIAGGVNVIDDVLENADALTPSPTALAELVAQQQRQQRLHQQKTEAPSELADVFIDVLSMNTEDSDVAILDGAQGLLGEGRIGVLLLTLPPTRESSVNTTTAVKGALLHKLRVEFHFVCFAIVEDVAEHESEHDLQESAKEDRGASVLPAEEELAAESPTIALLEVTTTMTAPAQPSGASSSSGDGASADSGGAEMVETAAVRVRGIPFPLEQRLPLLCVRSDAHPALVSALRASSLRRKRPSDVSESDGSAAAASSPPLPRVVSRHKKKHAREQCPVEEYVANNHLRFTRAPIRSRREGSEWHMRKLRSIAVEEFFAKSPESAAASTAAVTTAAEIASGGVAAATLEVTEALRETSSAGASIAAGEREVQQEKEQ